LLFARGAGTVATVRAPSSVGQNSSVEGAVERRRSHPARPCRIGTTQDQSGRNHRQDHFPPWNRTHACSPFVAHKATL